jgi:transcription antitermination factor NusG
MDGSSGSYARWIVVRTRVARENWALENVAAQGFEAYLPRIIEKQNRNGQKVAIAVPLFPTYLFVLAHQWRVLLSTFGVVSVIMRGSEPDALPKRVIEELKSRQNADGFVELPKAQTIQTGSKIRIIGGPFRDHVGVIAGMRENHRCRVLVDFLGRKTDVLIGAGELVLAA